MGTLHFLYIVVVPRLGLEPSVDGLPVLPAFQVTGDQEPVPARTSEPDGAGAVNKLLTSGLQMLDWLPQSSGGIRPSQVSIGTTTPKEVGGENSKAGVRRHGRALTHPVGGVGGDRGGGTEVCNPAGPRGSKGQAQASGRYPHLVDVLCSVHGSSCTEAPGDGWGLAGIHAANFKGTHRIRGPGLARI